MNNEPVALVSNMCNDSIDWKVDPLQLDEGTPLYTHSVKELTDEEIEGIAKANVDGHSSMEQLKWFAKAILRKAQEK